MENLTDYYPPDEFNVYIESNPSEIAKLLASRGVTCWGQGPIGKTGYYQLATASAQHKGDKRLAIVAESSLVHGSKATRIIL